MELPPNILTADKLRARLDRAGITPGAAARLFKVSDRTIRSWLSGERAIPDTIDRILVMQAALVRARGVIVLRELGNSETSPLGKNTIQAINKAIGDRKFPPVAKWRSLVKGPPQ